MNVEINRCTKRGCPRTHGPPIAVARSTREYVQSVHGQQYQLACTVPFRPEYISWPNICFAPGDLYRRHVLPCMESVCSFCNVGTSVDERLASSCLSNPRFGIRCKQGKIRLPLPRAHPEPLVSLLIVHCPSNPVSVDFHTNIRAYNTMFALPSIRASYDAE